VGKLRLAGRHRLLVGDSTDRAQAERVLDGIPADLLFTSPPYSDLRQYGGDVALEPAHLAKFLDARARTYVVNLGLTIRDREVSTYWNDYLAAAKERGLKLLSWCVWDKGNASAPAHQQAMFGLCHEWIFVFGEYRELNLTNPNKGAGEKSWGDCTVRERDGSMSKHGKLRVRTHRQLDTVIRLPPQKNYAADYTGHPAPFPVALAEEFVRAVTDEGETVMDPFSGSGTTLIACAAHGRRFRGIEIEPLYIDVILTRWAKFTGKDPVREDGMKWSALNAAEKV